MDIIKQTFDEANRAIGKNELINRLRQKEFTNRKLIDEFWETNLQQDTYNNRYLTDPQIPITHKQFTWQVDVMIPFKRSDDYFVLVMIEINSRFIIARKFKKKDANQIKIDKNNNSDFGDPQIPDGLLDDLFKRIVIEDLDNGKYINYLYGDGQFNTTFIKNFCDSKNIQYRFFNSNELHSYPNRNKLGFIDNAIKNLRMIIERMKITNSLTNDEVMTDKNLQISVDTMNNSYNRGLNDDLPFRKQITPAQAFKNEKYRSIILNTRNDRYEQAMDETDELNKEFDFDKPFLIRKTNKQTIRAGYLGPYFMMPFKKGFITKVNEMYFQDDLNILKKINNQELYQRYTDEKGNPLKIFRSFELKQYLGEYDEEELLDKDPIISQERRGAGFKDLLSERVDRALAREKVAERRKAGEKVRGRTSEGININTWFKENYPEIYKLWGNKQKSGLTFTDFVRQKYRDEYEEFLENKEDDE